jgi:hypothetical protein
MKIQCSCGTKYAFDITPEMGQTPVRFVCQNCGLDSSDMVNELIRRELAGTVPAEAPPAVAPPVKSPVATARMRISTAPLPVQAGGTAAASDAPQYCLKHNNQPATHRCVVCQKPICPKCMELFGYLCSPFCKTRAEALKIDVPFYAGQKTVVEAKYWKKVGTIFAAAGTVVAALFGFWFWYAWFGSVPHPAFSVRFDDPAYTGEGRFCGKDQIVFLHGPTLARYDIKAKTKIWSLELYTRQQVAEEVPRMEKYIGDLGRPVDPAEAKRMAETELGRAFHLQVSGSNVWVATPEKLTHYDWNTGRVLDEIPLREENGSFISQGDELLSVNENVVGQQMVTHINLANGETRTEEIGGAEKTAVAAGKSGAGATLLASSRGAGGAPTAGLPVGTPGADAGKPMDPEKVAEQAQRLPLAARIALPAVLANDMHQERIEAELKDQPPAPRQPARLPRLKTAPGAGVPDHFTPIISKYGTVLYSERLLEEKTISHEAMKAPPKKSVLDGDLNASKTMDAANEILNEMQRDRGGGTVEEDVSRYQVTLRRPDSTEPSDWTGEVIGPPRLFPLKTVNALTAGKTLTVFDKTNRKLWQATLSYSVTGGFPGWGAEESSYGDGPCVERGDTLYVFDAAVLTAFDLATGNARWRLSSVGVVGIFFDDEGKLYVNTTTASPENIKYSRQIDISQKIDDVFLKIDPKTGKMLWSAHPGGLISYLSGKYIFATYWHEATGEDNSLAALSGAGSNESFLKIRRISAKDGRSLWDYQQNRAPLDARFNGNQIELVFKKEVQVLTFLSF